MSVTIKGSGQVPVQIISTTKTDQFTTTSASFVDITGLSVTITPTSASNKVLVILSLSCSASGNRDGNFQILRNSTVVPAVGITGPLINASNGAYINSMLTMIQSFVDSPATTSAVTYKVQGNINADTLYVNRRALDTVFTGQSTITVMEISG